MIFAKEGQVFIVRFFSGKNAYAFTTEVLRVYSTPYPHLHLRYPARVKGLVVRKGERVAVKIICSIDLPAPAGPARFAGTIQNLSTGGASRPASRRLQATLVVKFRVFIGEIESLLSIDATVSFDPDERRGRDALRGQVQRHQAGNADNAHRLRLSDTAQKPARENSVRTPSRALSLSYSLLFVRLRLQVCMQHDAA